MINSDFCILWVIMIEVVLSVLFNLWISCLIILSVIGLRLVNGLLYMISIGLSVMVWVSVICWVMLLESLLGINFCVLCRLIVFSFISMRLWIIFFDMLVCLWIGKVMLLKIDILVNSVLNWNNIFILWCRWYNLLCDIL